MNSSKLSYGLSLAKKPGSSKPGSAKRKPIFGGDEDSDDERGSGPRAEAITELDDFPSTDAPEPGDASRTNSKSKGGMPTRPPAGKPKASQAATPFGDLSSALTSRKFAKEAEKLDPSIYDYDAAYDSFKAAKKAALTAGSAAVAERKPQYMSNLKKMAEVRERDRRIAEDKKMQREREAEGDEYADKEKFVTEAYKRQQEESRRLEEEERRREEEEARKNEAGGMTGFYKQLLDRDEQKQAEIRRAAEERLKRGPAAKEKDEEEEEEEEDDKAAAKLAQEINAKGGSVVVNDEGEVVDKRQLLRGGLNVTAKKKTELQREEEASRAAAAAAAQARAREQASRGVFAGGKQAARDRQSRMLEAQYEQALKRTREEEEAEAKKIELEAKSRKTDADISSAKERYLARKRAEAEAKKKGTGE